VSGPWRAALLWVLCSALWVGAAEGFQAWVLADPPDGLVPHGVLADPAQVGIAAVYGAFVREAAEGGGPRMHNAQTAVPHPPTLLRPWEWLLGRALRAADKSPRQALRAERAAALPLFLLGVGCLARVTLQHRRTRLALVAAAVGGGSAHWLVAALPGAQAHTQWWRSWLEAHAASTSGAGLTYPAFALGAPHLLLEVAWFALALAAAIAAAERRHCGLSLAAGLAVLGLACVRPYTVPIALAAGAAAEFPALLQAGARAAAVVRLAALALPVAPYLAHLFAVLRGETIFSSLDVYHPAPPLHELLLWVGLPGLVLPWLLWRARRAGGRLRLQPRDLALVTALATLLATAHGEPWIAFEVEVLLPLALLVAVVAALALERRPLAAPWIGAGLALHLGGGLVWYVEVSERARDPRGGFYLLPEESAALGHVEWTRPRSAMTADRPPAVLVCTPELGPLVPWLGGVRVVAGHFDHTPDHRRRSALVRQFLTSGQGLEELRREGATLVLDGPRERSLRGGQPLPLESWPGARSVFEGPFLRLIELVAEVPGAQSPPGPAPAVEPR
jgi:hypothetical protein